MMRKSLCGEQCRLPFCRNSGAGKRRQCDGKTLRRAKRAVTVASVAEFTELHWITIDSGQNHYPI